MSTIKSLEEYRRALEQHYKRIRQHGEAGPYNSQTRKYDSVPEPKADSFVPTEALPWASKIRAVVLASHEALSKLPK